MKWQEAEKRMLAGETLRTKNFNYRIQNGKLHYYYNNKWEEAHVAYNNVVNTDWQPLPAKTYPCLEAIELCLREGRRFKDKGGQCIWRNAGRLDAGTPDDNEDDAFIINYNDLDEEWTEVIE